MLWLTVNTLDSLMMVLWSLIIVDPHEPKSTIGYMLRKDFVHVTECRITSPKYRALT